MPKEKEEVRGVYASNFYDAASIPRCNVCNEKRRTNSQGLFCPEGRTDCPIVEVKLDVVQQPGKNTTAVPTGSAPKPEIPIGDSDGSDGGKTSPGG